MKEYIVLVRKNFNHKDGTEKYVWRAYTYHDLLKNTYENCIFQYHVYALKANSKKEAIRKAKLI